MASMALGAHLLLALAAVLAVSRLAGAAAVRLRQPRVVGEIAAGLLLGPSAFGWLAPAAFAALFTAEVRAVLAGLGTLGLALFMLLIGLELDPVHVSARRRAVIGIAVGSIGLPFAVGLLLGLVALSPLAPPGLDRRLFAAFIGVALAITAFPVLARILAERGLLRSEVGGLALACAALNDLSAWGLLTVILGVARVGRAAAPGRAVAALLAFGLALATVRPAWGWLTARHRRAGRLSPSILAGVALLLGLSAAAAEAAGIHLAFGAFALGALAPRGALSEALTARLTPLVNVVLPIYFAAAGLRASIGLLDSAAAWGLFVAVLVGAIGAKLVGSAVAARLAGLGWRDALALGALMNARGLMELVVLQIGLDAGLLTPTLFTMLVLMALLTTVMTTPALLALGRGGASK